MFIILICFFEVLEVFVIEIVFFSVSLFFFNSCFFIVRFCILNINLFFIILLIVEYLYDFILFFKCVINWFIVLEFFWDNC